MFNTLDGRFNQKSNFYEANEMNIRIVSIVIGFWQLSLCRILELGKQNDQFICVGLL